MRSLYTPEELEWSITETNTENEIRFYGARVQHYNGYLIGTICGVPHVKEINFPRRVQVKWDNRASKPGVIKTWENLEDLIELT